MPLDLWFESGRSSGRNWSARWLRRFFPEAALASRGLRAWSISFRHPSKGKPHCPGRRSALRKYAFPLATFPQEEMHTYGELSGGPGSAVYLSKDGGDRKSTRLNSSH